MNEFDLHLICFLLSQELAESSTSSSSSLAASSLPELQLSTLTPVEDFDDIILKAKPFLESDQAAGNDLSMTR